MIRIDWDRVQEADRPMALSDILALIRNVKRTGDQHQGACPLCESGEADGHHLYIKEDGGKVLMYCQRCNAPMRELFNALPKEQLPPAEARYIPATPANVVEDYYHDYRNADGTLAYRKRRQKFADGKKKFSFFSAIGYTKPEGSIWIYNFDKLAAADRGTRVYIVEGEKCADVMTEQGFLAITTCTGSKKEINFTDEERRVLSEFFDKVIIPDNDEAGLEYIKAWDNVKVLRLPDIWPDCPPKGDVADYFAEGLPREYISEYKFIQIDLPLFVGQKYKVDYCGVHTRKDTKDDGYSIHTSPHPIIPYRRFKDVWTGREKYEVAYFRDGAWQFTTIPAEELLNGKQLQRFASMGIMVTASGAKYLADYFKDYIDNKKMPPLPTSSRIGWYKDEFVPYTGKTKLDCLSDAIMRAVVPMGTFDKWLAGVQPLWQTRPEICAFMAAGMAAVAVGREQADTFVCELYGATELGKTKALEVVASMFGLPSSNGLMFIMDSTVNFMFDNLNMLGNIPMCLDENEARRNTFEAQRMRSPENAWLYQITAGKGRQRMKSGHEAEAPTRWNNTILVTGESSMTNEATAEGAQNRIIGINITKSLTRDFASVSRAIKNNYGHAVRKFVPELLKIKDLGLEREKIYREIMAKNHDVTGKMANNGSFIWLAYTLMERFMGKGAVDLDYIVGCLKTKHDVDMTDTVYRVITDWIAAKDSSIRRCKNYPWAERGEEQSEHLENSGEIIGVKYPDYVAVNKTKLDQLLLSNFGKPLKDFQKRLADKGYIITSTSGGKVFYANNVTQDGYTFKGVKVQI